MADCYWHKTLDEKSSYLCTFNTPFGRYKFNRMPFGICLASDIAQKMVESIFGGMQGVVTIYDDIIIGADDINEHDAILKQVLDRARQRNVKFNRKKIQLRVKEVKFIGNIVSSSGFKPDPEKVKAILEMPCPKSKLDLQRLLGVVNYLSSYIPNLSEVTAPLRSLLKKDILWSWSHEHNRSLDTIKQILTSKPVLSFFDTQKSVTLQVDASQQGLGACILQEDHPVAYASRSLNTAEQHYAQIEKELLAVVYGCERFHQYLYGRNIVIQSDHKPLEYIMKKPLSQAPPRIQRLLIRLQKYQFDLVYVPGKHLHIADTLSRAFLDEAVEQSEIHDEAEVMIHTLLSSLPVSDEKLKEIIRETAADETLQTLKKTMLQGWPEHRHKAPREVQPFWSVKHEISEAHGLLLKDGKLIIPSTMRNQLLNIVHESHLGIEKCRARARMVMYWPGMSTDIESLVSKCTVCASHRNMNPKEPLQPHPIPEYPWQKLASDIFEYQGKSHIVVVDYYSKYIETSAISSKTAGTIIAHLKSIFARHGIPEELIADNMPYNSKELKDFAKNWGFKITTTSPTYAQSNGMSEKAVQTVKRILKKTQDPYIGLLEYRNTPVTGMKYTPMQLHMNRTARTKLPTLPAMMKPAIPTDAQQQLYQRQAKQKYFYDQGAKPLVSLQIGDGVRLRQGKEWVPALVTGRDATPRSYHVTTPNGQCYRRNRRHLLMTAEPKPVILEPDSEMNADTPGMQLEPSASHVENPVEQQPEALEVPPLRRSTRATKLPSKLQDYYM